jgi:peptide/nickel transport system substrate-binding protein
MLSLLLVSAACAAPAGQQPGSGPSTERPVAPKTLTIGIRHALPDFGGLTRTAGTSAANVPPIVQDGLNYTDYEGLVHPLLAAEMPSIERGTWKIFDDGKMETTWKLKSNVKWHDGAQLTSGDFAFSSTVARDKELASSPTPSIALQSGVTVADPLTFTILWSGPYVEANITGVGAILPRHLLEATYLQADKQVFLNHPYFTTEYIGTGPYKLVSWLPGSDMEFTRFDDYHLGRPPLDRVFVKVSADPNTLVAGILAGDLDIILPPGVALDSALEVQKRWAGTGNEVRADVINKIIQLEIQFRPEQAQPTRGLREKPVRQALLQALDRHALADFMTGGIAPVADSWYPSNDPLRKDVEPFIPQYPYDLSAAQRLLAGAGWQRDSAGNLVNSASNEKFDLEIRTQDQAGFDKMATVVAQDWKAIGVQGQVVIQPPSRLGDREYEASYTGVFTSNISNAQYVQTRLDSRMTQTAANRYQGANRGAYINPRVDQLYDALNTTLDPKARIPIHQEFVKELMTDIAVMPLYPDINPVLKRQGVTDHRATGSTWTWFFFDYDKS